MRTRRPNSVLYWSLHLRIGANVFPPGAALLSLASPSPRNAQAGLGWTGRVSLSLPGVEPSLAVYGAACQVLHYSSTARYVHRCCCCYC